MSTPKIIGFDAAYATYVLGNEVLIDANFSESVVVDTRAGVPMLVLSNGGVAFYDTRASSGNGVSGGVSASQQKHRFVYTVAQGDRASADLGVVAFAENDALLKGAASGVAADVTITAGVNDLAMNSASQGVVVNPGSTVVQTDVTAPRIVKMVATSDRYEVGETVRIGVTFDEAVAVNASAGLPTLVLSNGGTAGYVGGNSTKTLYFDYAVTAQSGASSDLDVNGVLLNGAQIRDGAGNLATLTVVAGSNNLAPYADVAIGAAIGAGGGTGDGTGTNTDTKAPSIESLSAPVGVYKTGEEARITLKFDEAVQVRTQDGAAKPFLWLGNGGTAVYSSGSGTGTLTFKYTVSATDSNTQALAVQALVLQDAVIEDLSGNAAKLDLPSNAAALAGVQINATAPYIVGVYGVDEVYNPGDVVALTVRLSEPVDVTLSGSGVAPLLKLSNGATAVYKSGSGSEMLEFTYTVGAQDKSSADLGVSGVTLPAGTSIVSVGTGNGVSLGVPNGILSSTADIEIDTLGPTVVVSVADTVLKAGESTTVTFTFSEPVGNPQAAIQVSNGTLTDLVTTETGQAGTIWVGTFTPNSGVQAQDISVAVDSSKVKDLAGNAGVGYGASQGIDIDTALPTAQITHTTQSAGVRLHTITFSEAVSTLSAQDVQVAGGSKGALTQLDARTYTLAVTPTGTGTDTVVVRIAPGAVTDLAGNGNGEISYAKPVDEVAPRVQSVWALDSAGEVAASAAYTNADQVRLVVKFDEAVQIDVSKPEPYLALNNGRKATYVGDGALSSTHEFVYTVQNGDATNSLDTLGISAVAGQITDAAGNPARLVITPSVNNLKSLSEVSIDGLVPSISAISATEGFYQPGAVLSINVQFSEEVTVDQTNGSPVLALSNGKTAAYSAGSGTSRLTFTYAVQDGDQDDAALDALALAENGAVLQDAAGNPANVTIEVGRNNLASRSSVQVDAEQARIAQISANAGEYKAGESIDISLVFNKAIELDTTQGEPSLMLSNGSIARYNEQKSSALASVVVFDYVVTPEDMEDAQLTVVALRDGYATFSGFVGGPANLALPNTNADGETVLGGAQGPVVIDLTPPELLSVSLSDTALQAGERATVTFTFSEEVAGLRLQDLEVSGGTLTNLAPSASDASVWTATFTPLRNVEASDVQVTVRPVAVRDGANNLSHTQVLSSTAFEIDTRYPEVSFTSDMQGQVSAGAVHVTMTFAETVTWNSPVATSEAELLKVLNIRGGTFVKDSFIETIPGKQWELDIEPLENSTDPIRVRLLEGAVDDLAGNPSVASGCSKWIRTLRTSRR